MLGLRRGERVVHRVVAFGVFVPFEEGKIHHPQWLEDFGVAQLQRTAHVKPQFVQLAANVVQIA